MRLLVARPAAPAGAPALRAQDSVIVIDPDAPPADTVDARQARRRRWSRSCSRFYNDSATTRMQGDVTFPAGSQLRRATGAATAASLRIAGRVRGPIAVINGTLYLLPGADVEGDILVVGGRLIRAASGAPCQAPSACIWDAAPVLRTAEGLLVLRERRRPLGELATARDHASRPARSGPRCSSPPAAPTTGSRGCRSCSGRSSSSGRPAGDLRCGSTCAASSAPRARDDRLSSDFGYAARAEFRIRQRLRRRRAGLQRGRADRGPAALPQRDRLVGLPAAAGLPRLLRAARRAAGWPGSSLIRPLRFELSRPPGRRERSVRANDPWSLFRNSDRWRRNPLIDDGHYFTTGVQLDFDTRNDRDLPDAPAGCIRARFEHSTSDDVAPVALPAEVRPAIPTGGGYAFDRILLDVRRYTRLTPVAAGQRPAPARRVDRRRPLAGPAPGLPRRARPAARATASARSPARPSGFSDPSRARALRPRAQRPGRGAHPARTQSGLPDARPRRKPDRAVHRHRGSRTWCLLADAGKAWLAGDGPGQVPVNRIPIVQRMGGRRRRRARRRGRSAPISRRASPRASRSSSSSGCSAASSAHHVSPLALPALAASGVLVAARAAAGGSAPPAPRRRRVRLEPVRLALRQRLRAGAAGSGGALGKPAGGRPLARRAALGPARCGCTTGWRCGARGRAGSICCPPGRVGRGGAARAAAGPVHDAHRLRQPGAGAPVRHAGRAERGARLRLSGERAPGGAGDATTTRPRWRSRRCRIPTWMSWSGFWRATCETWRRAGRGSATRWAAGRHGFCCGWRDCRA